MANPPPVLALAIPVLGWYTVTFGGVQISQMLGLSGTSFLSSPDGVNTGLVGVGDGAMIHLNGFAETGDNGSLWLQWDADGLQTPDGQTVWNPYPSNATAGRWLAQLPIAPPVTRTVTTGAIIALAPLTTLVAVRKITPSVTTLQLPAMAAVIAAQGLGVRTVVKVDGNAPRFPTTVVTTDGTTFDNQQGVTSYVVNGLFEEISFAPDGITWNVGG